MVLSASQVQAKSATGKHKAVGWVEQVRVKDVDVTLNAKLDTGAKTSSLSAKVLGTKDNPNPEEGYTDQTVVFSLIDADSEDEKIFERHVVRYVKIKLKEGGFSRRPVVRMTFCIADRLVSDEVNLTDRSFFSYPILVGRNMLSKAKLHVDSSRQNIAPARCKSDKEGQQKGEDA